jgi:hypothetical protein
VSVSVSVITGRITLIEPDVFVDLVVVVGVNVDFDGDGDLDMVGER